MQTTDLIRTAAVPSKLADLRDVPLADLPDLGAILNQAVSGVMPDSQATLVPVAAFSSAI
jgi:hypothetical protein